MAEKTSIEWCDHTFNPWIGCAKVHAGCEHCYAEADQDKRRGRVRWGPKGTRSLTKTWGEPVKWNKAAMHRFAMADSARTLNEAEAMRRKPRVFCASLCDVLEDWDGPMLDSNGQILVHANGRYEPEVTEQHESCSRVTMDDVRHNMFDLWRDCQNVDWLVLSKHGFWDGAESGILAKWPKKNGQHERFPNVWLLTSVSDQATADRLIPELLKCEALCGLLGVSAEPLLGPIDFRQYIEVSGGGYPKLSWVILGGESGPHSRPCCVDWIRDGVDQCQKAGVAAFVKQLGAVVHDRVRPFEPPAFWPQGTKVSASSDPQYHRITLRHNKGGDPSEWAEDLQVREIPGQEEMVR